MRLKRTKTDRGWARIEFKDRYNCECSIQKSSLATEDAIWFGIDDANPQILVPGKGWQPVELPPGTLCATRMHLTQAQVRSLLPILQHFAETGELPVKPTVRISTRFRKILGGIKTQEVPDGN